MKVNSHLEDFIHKLYQQMGVHKPAQLNIKTISNAMDINWERTSEAILYDDMTAIFIDSRINNQLQWQDFCHELCHPLLHTGEGINLTCLPYSVNIRSLKPIILCITLVYLHLCWMNWGLEIVHRKQYILFDSCSTLIMNLLKLD